MPRSLRIATVVAISALAASAAGAEEPAFGSVLQPRIVEGVAQMPPGASYVGGYTSPGGTARQVVHFYSRRDPDDNSPEGVSYRSVPFASRSYETETSTELQSWADGATCAPLYGVMYEFTRLSPPLFHTPRFGDEPRGAARLGALSMPIHGPIVSVWGYARQADGAPMSMMLTGDSGIIDRWVKFAEDQLAGCWSSEAPNIPRR